MPAVAEDDLVAHAVLALVGTCERSHLDGLHVAAGVLDLALERLELGPGEGVFVSVGPVTGRHEFKV